MGILKDVVDISFLEAFSLEEGNDYLVSSSQVFSAKKIALPKKAKVYVYINALKVQNFLK